MMYQRDMSYALVGLAKSLQKELNDLGKSGVGAEEEKGENSGHDQNHDRSADGLLAARPMNLLDSFNFDLPDKFAD